LLPASSFAERKDWVVESRTASNIEQKKEIVSAKNKYTTSRNISIKPLFKTYFHNVDII
jgi:hypothetical protein